MSYFLLGMAIILWCWGLWMLFRRMTFFFASLRTDGHLCSFERKERNGVKCYYPVVEFTDEGGSRHELVAKDSFEDKHDCPRDRKFVVLYLPAHPEEGFVSTYFQYWAATALVLFLALASTMAFLRFATF